MRKFFLILLFVCISKYAYSQEEHYIIKENLPYYEDSLSKQDNSIKEQCVLDLYYPKDQKGFATIVWFHGGGLTSGKKEIPETLMQKGFCIVGVNYRLSPTVQSPKYIEDAAASVAWVFKHITEYGGDSSLIFVSGHSAGGYLTCMIGLDKKWLGKFNIDANKIAGLIPLSGQTITHFTIRKERGIKDTQPIIDDMAPLFYIRADAPPLLLITGDRNMELLGRYEENAYLMRMMKIVGHKDVQLFELQGYGHDMLKPGFPLLINEVQRIIGNKGLKKN
jgi:acetyl esterase/lipase